MFNGGLEDASSGSCDRDGAYNDDDNNNREKGERKGETKLLTRSSNHLFSLFESKVSFL